MGDERHRIVDERSVGPYRSPRQKRQLLLAGVAVVAAAGLAAGAWLLLSPHQQTYTLRGYETAVVQKTALTETTQASGTVAIPVQMNIPSPEEGYAATVSAAEGDTVKKGQVLARIDVPTLRNDLQDLQSSLADAQRAYDKTIAADRIDLDRKAREIAAAATDIAAQQAVVDRTAQIAAAGGATQNDVDTARRSLAALEDARTEKALQLDEQKQLDALDEQAAQAKITDLQVQVKRLQDRIAAATITSPMAGEVLAVSASLNVPGSLITNGTSLFTVADPASAIVELEVLEQYSSLLTVDTPVSLTVGSATIAGRITGIGRVATQSSDGLGATVTVKVKPESGTTKLLEGNTAVGTLTLGTTEGALTLPRGPYLTTGSERWVYKVDGTVARRVAVTLGSTEGTNVQVLSGVSAGDTIITSGYQNFIEYTTISLEKGASK
jgi:HlyD family secretion protein